MEQSQQYRSNTERLFMKKQTWVLAQGLCTITLIGTSMTEKSLFKNRPKSESKSCWNHGQHSVRQISLTSRWMITKALLYKSRVGPATVGFVDMM